MNFNEINTNTSANASQATLNQLVKQMLQINPQLLADWEAYEAASSQLYQDMMKTPSNAVNADLAAMQQALSKFTTDAQNQGWFTLVNVLQGYNIGSPSPMQQLENDISDGNFSGNYGPARWDISSDGPLGSIDKQVYQLFSL